jgi:hypothetical protein
MEIMVERTFFQWNHHGCGQFLSIRRDFEGNQRKSRSSNITKERLIWRLVSGIYSLSTSPRLRARIRGVGIEDTPSTTVQSCHVSSGTQNCRWLCRLHSSLRRRDREFRAFPRVTDTERTPSTNSRQSVHLLLGGCHPFSSRYPRDTRRPCLYLCV